MRQASGLRPRAPDVVQAEREQLVEALLLRDDAAGDDDHGPNPIDPLRPEYRAASRKATPALRVVGTLAGGYTPAFLQSAIGRQRGTTEVAAMIRRAHLTGNAYRNFNYLIASPRQRRGAGDRPAGPRQVPGQGRERGWQITQIFNTHEHHDHIGGNAAMVAATGAKVLAHEQAGGASGRRPRVGAGDVIKVGNRVELECLDTPGHTMCHICLCAHGDRPAIFSGDTLFNAGAGNCHNGGNPDALYDTFSGASSPGCPTRRASIRARLRREQPALHARASPTTRPRRRCSPASRTTTRRSAGDDAGRREGGQHLLRLDSPGVIARLREDFPDLAANPDPRTVFVKLRELRNRW